MILLLRIVGEIMIICYDCCWVMLLKIIHALGVANCAIVIQVVLFDEFIMKWVKMKKCDF